MPPPRLTRFPPTSFSDCDVSEIDPLWQSYGVPSDNQERTAKRRRIEDCARRYLSGDSLHIQSAALMGPFDKGWQNPWKAPGFILPVVQENVTIESSAEISAQADVHLPKQNPEPQQKELEAKAKASKPKKKVAPKRGKGKGKAKATPALPALPLETGVESWLKRRPAQVESRSKEIEIQDLHEPTPSRPSKILVARTASPIKSRARRKRQTRQTTKAQQAQLPLTTLSKPSNPSNIKEKPISGRKPLNNEAVEAEKSSVVLSSLVPAKDSYEQALSRDIHKSLAKIQENLNHPEAQAKDRKRRFMTFNSPHQSKPLLGKEPLETTKVFEPAEAMPISNGSDESPIIETPVPVNAGDQAQVAKHQDRTVDAPAESPIQCSAVKSIAEAALARMENTAAAEVTVCGLPRENSPQRPEGAVSDYQPSKSNETTTTTTLMDDINPRSNELKSKEKSAPTEVSSTNLRIPSFPEHQDSKAYSPPSIDLTTQAALFQAQCAFQAEFGVESPFKSQLPSPVFARYPLPQTGTTVTPFRALRQPQHRQSVPGLGSTQDLLAAAKDVSFSTGKRHSTTKKKRASFADWPASKAASPPPDENCDPSMKKRAHITAAATTGSQQGVEPLKPASQPSSQSLRSCLKSAPLREDSSQGNSQPLPQSEAQLPTVSFLPSVPYSGGGAVQGILAASWQIGQGQGREDGEGGEMSLDLDLERSLDEAVEFLNVDYHM
jgi:hypothetical protein